MRNHMSIISKRTDIKKKQKLAAANKIIACANGLFSDKTVQLIMSKMGVQKEQHDNEAHYLSIERQAVERSELVDGDIFLMSGASRAHNTLTSNLVFEFGKHFQHRDCQAYSSDMRVKINSAGNYVYPDVVVACDPQQFDDAHLDNLLNPVLIIEVLSKSTQDYDRDYKFYLYRQLNSLQHYILVSQDKKQVEHYQRQPSNQWLLTILTQDTDILDLQDLKVQIPLADIYAKVAFVST